MTYADYKELTFERRENGVLLITLNRPEKYNAADEGMHRELARVWEALEIAQTLATGSQLAIRWTKRALNNWLKAAGPIFDQSAAYEMLGFMGPDVAEGAAALREKRPPRFPSAVRSIP